MKSKTSSKELAKYIAEFEIQDQFDRMFYVYHSGEAKAESENVTVIGPEKLAELVVEAGLMKWLIQKVT